MQRMLRRDCRLSHSARQRQGDLRVILPRGCRSIKPADYCHSNKCPLGNSAIDEAGDYTPAASAEQPHRDRASSGHWPQCVCCTSDVRSSSENDTSSTPLARAQVAASTVLRDPLSPPLAASSRASPTRCPTPPPASTAEGKPPPCDDTRRLRKPKQVKAQALGARLFDPRAHPRRDTPRYRHLHRSGLTLCLCRGAPLQARPIHRPRLSLLPQRPTTVLSDNGSEFGADFAQLLKERGIQRWYTYPKTPKMNARRSLQSHDPRVLRG